jgi:phosphatidylglycerol:prolipoprotein diacylglycerol transferase
MPTLPQPTAYSFLLAAAIVLSGLLLWRLRRRDADLLAIYVFTLGGAFVGAKVVYLLAEGWMFAGHERRWEIWLTGKTILGALLFGYAAAELAKKLLSYDRVTGDWFALAVVPGIVLGRVGCLTQGCCNGKQCAPAWWTVQDAAGVHRWPSVPLEMAFNLAVWAALLACHRHGRQRGQLFHIYLMSYGLFRFLHEFARNTPRIAGVCTGYHLAAAGVFALGFWGYWRRSRQSAATQPRTTPPA